MTTSPTLYNCKTQDERDFNVFETLPPFHIPHDRTFQRLHARNVDLSVTSFDKCFCCPIYLEWSVLSVRQVEWNGIFKGSLEYARSKPEIDRQKKWDLDACPDSLKVYLQERQDE